jgi:hypothetical protein
MRLVLYSLLLAYALLCAPALSDVETGVPPGLWPWIPRVLHPQDTRPCPLNPNAPEPGETAAKGARICAWPDRLRLDLGRHGGIFTQTWQVFADAWVPLPGDPENWPQDVRADPPARTRSRPGARGHPVAHSEVWSFAARPDLRQIDLIGCEETWFFHNRTMFI